MTLRPIAISAAILLVASIAGVLWLRGKDNTALWGRISGTLSAAEEICRNFNIRIDSVMWKDSLTRHGVTQQKLEDEKFKGGWERGYGETYRRLLHFPLEGEYQFCNTLLEEYGENGRYVRGMLVVRSR